MAKKNQTACQYNKELMKLCKYSGEKGISLQFLQDVHKILQKKGGIVFPKPQVTGILQKKNGKA